MTDVSEENRFLLLEFIANLLAKDFQVKLLLLARNRPVLFSHYKYPTLSYILYPYLLSGNIGWIIGNGFHSS